MKTALGLLSDILEYTDEETAVTYLEEMKNVEICPTVVTIRSSMKEENIPQLEQLSDEILG